MSEYHRMAPGHRLLRRANGAIFVAVRVLHQDCADEVRAQLARQIAPRQPFALEVTTNFRPVGIDRAAAAGEAIDALGSRGLLEIVDLQRRAAHRAGSAGFSERRSHSFLAPPLDSVVTAARYTLSLFELGRDRRFSKVNDCRRHR